MRSIGRGARGARIIALSGALLLACCRPDAGVRKDDPLAEGGSSGNGGAAGVLNVGGYAGKLDNDFSPPDAVPDDAGEPPRRDDAGIVSTDAQVPSERVDAGGELPPLPQWSALNYLQCFCNDETTHEMCLDYVITDYAWQDIFCGEVCARHLGLSAIGALDSDPFCDAPLRVGPDRLECRCADGHAASLCADLSCFDELQRENVCHATCAEHGGTVATECEDFDHEACIPPGTTLLICGCKNGEEVLHCTSHDCHQGGAGGENCRASCRDKGGDAYVGCAMEDARCL